MHGGLDAEMPKIHEDDETKYIFDMTLQEIREHLAQTPYYKKSMKDVQKEGTKYLVKMDGSE